LLLLGCGPELDMQRDPAGEDIEFTRVEPGQCLWREFPEIPVWRSVKVVDCGGDRWQVKLLNRFNAESAGSYPGDAAFLEQARSRCAAGWTEFLAPAELDWADGDRSVACLQHRVAGEAPAGTPAPQ
jgi:hypothetical protein